MKLNKDQGPGRELYSWWHNVTQLREDGGDRAARAIIRRAHDITAVTLTQPYQYLFQRMRHAGWNDGYPSANDALAAAVGLLVHVDTDAPGQSLAEAMSVHPEGSDKACVSETRFKRLLETADLDALFLGLRRASPLMRKGLPVMALANDVLSWAWPDQREAVKKAWAYDYAWPAK